MGFGDANESDALQSDMGESDTGKDNLEEPPEFINEPGQDARFKQLTGLDTLCALTTDDELQCWGDNSKGQAVPPEGRFTDVRVGANFGCAIGMDSSISCWGDETILAEINSKISEWSVRKIAVNSFDVCAITMAGTIQCVGDERTFSAGNEPAGNNWEYLDISDTQACAIDNNALMNCWGRIAEEELPFIVEGVKDVKLTANKINVLYNEFNFNNQTPDLLFETISASPTNVVYLDKNKGVFQGLSPEGYNNNKARYKFGPEENLRSLVVFRSDGLPNAKVCGLTEPGQFKCIEANMFREITNTGEYLEEALKLCNETPIAVAQSTPIQLKPSDKIYIRFSPDSFLGMGPLEAGEMVIASEKIHGVSDSGRFNEGVLRIQYFSTYTSKQTSLASVFKLDPDSPFYTGTYFGANFTEDEESKIGCITLENNDQKTMNLNITFEFATFE